MIKEKKIIYVLLILITSLVVIPKFFQNDLFFDIKTGESILKYGIDFIDHFSFISGLTYIYHHWLYDLVIYYIYSLFNFNGVFIFNLIIYSIFGCVVFFINNKRINNCLISFVVTLFVIIISSYAFGSRVQSITYILFLLEIYFLEKLYVDGKKKYALYLLIISILIVNLHMPLWIFSLILFLPYIFEYLINKVLSKSKKYINIFSNKIVIVSPKNTKLLLFTFILMIFSGLLSPLKYYPYIFFTKSLFNSSYAFIGEMSKTVLYYRIWEIYLVIFIILLLLINKCKIKLRDLSLFIGLFLFSIIAFRNVIYFYIIIPTIIVKIISESYNINFNIDKLIQKRVKFNKRIVGVFTCIFLSIIYIILLNNLDLSSNDFNISKSYPVKSVQYIKTNLDYKNIILYNDFDYGSYIEFNDIPVFIDSRAEVYLKEFNGGKDIIGDYLKTQSVKDYKKIFKKYDFTHALVYRESDISYLLSIDHNYKKIFEEDNYVLYENVKMVK